MNNDSVSHNTDTDTAVRSQTDSNDTVLNAVHAHDVSREHTDAEKNPTQMMHTNTEVAVVHADAFQAMTPVAGPARTQEQENVCSKQSISDRIEQAADAMLRSGKAPTKATLGKREYAELSGDLDQSAHSVKVTTLMTQSGLLDLVQSEDDSRFSIE